jgi:hypothetical protein
VNVEKNAPAPLASANNNEVPQERTPRSYTSDSYQKILDYHVGEIVLTTIIFGVILFIRLHR